jgi:protein arginine kinase activator
MLCQQCKKREANRHESVRSEDGSWAEVHLCDTCAEEKGEVTLLSQASLVQALIEGAAQLSTARPAGTARSCPKCGITYAEFRARGRLGCPYDYEVFQAELVPLIERIHHGGAQHLGKSPTSTDGRSEADQELIELRRALAEAVQREQYEEAARLRDRVRQVEQGVAAPAAPPPPSPPAPPPPAKERKPGKKK